MNEVAHNQKLFVYNVTEGFLCRFIKEQYINYETF